MTENKERRKELNKELNEEQEEMRKISTEATLPRKHNQI